MEQSALTKAHRPIDWNFKLLANDLLGGRHGGKS
jgi:hypothetical protein